MLNFTFLVTLLSFLLVFGHLRIPTSTTWVFELPVPLTKLNFSKFNFRNEEIFARPKESALYQFSLAKEARCQPVVTNFDQIAPRYLQTSFLIHNCQEAELCTSLYMHKVRADENDLILILSGLQNQMWPDLSLHYWHRHYNSHCKHAFQLETLFMLQWSGKCFVVTSADPRGQSDL